jgi:acetyl-CoA carboxylase / biotin carboxylase 1
MQWHRSGLIALWEFSEEHLKQRNGQDAPLKQQVENPVEKRWGVMVVIKSLQFLPTSIDAALKETSQYRAAVGSISNGNHINFNQSNMLHIALVGINNQMSTLQDRFVFPPYPYVTICCNKKIFQADYLNNLADVVEFDVTLSTFSLCSGDEDQAQERVNKLSKILKDNTVTSHLNDACVKVVTCIIQRDEGRPPMRHSFQWSIDKLYYEEDPMVRHVEPPLSTFLELVCCYILLNLFEPYILLYMYHLTIYL